MAITQTVFSDGTVPVTAYDELRHKVQDGDLLLCSGSATFSKLIQAATNSIWSHVGFVMWLRAIDRLVVLESVESMGVRAVPLSSYIADYSGSGTGYPGRLLIARHAELSGKPLSSEFGQFAVDLLGHPYHTDEIVQIAAHIASGGLALEREFADAKQFICSEYVSACYDRIGLSVQRSHWHFIAPADFANDPNVRGIAIRKSTGLASDRCPHRCWTLHLPLMDCCASEGSGAAYVGSTKPR